MIVYDPKIITPIFYMTSGLLTVAWALPKLLVDRFVSSNMGTVGVQVEDLS